MDNIEISDRKYWKELNYYGGLLYCQLLEIDGKNDWRIVKDDDSWDIKTQLQKLVGGTTWFMQDGNAYPTYFLDNTKFWIVPIRDLSS